LLQRILFDREHERSKLRELNLSRREFLRFLGYMTMILSIIWVKIPSIFAPVKNNSLQQQNVGTDNFGISKIYRTKESGREWYINMQDPLADGIFDPQTEITKNSDGSWRVGSSNRDEGFNGKYHVVMNVDTPLGQKEWRDVEITGYFKAIEVDSGDDDDGDNEYSSTGILQWYARGNRHSNDVPCEGTSLKCRIHSDGHVGWIKEIWHDGGYTRERGISKPTDSIKGRWIGWKAVMYNTPEENSSSVKMEGYLDDTASNHWVKVTEVTDSGNWYSRDQRFEEADCNRPRNYIVTNSGLKAAYRSDGVRWDFKYLSVREIKVP
jgi:hypothetical protein